MSDHDDLLERLDRLSGQVQRGRVDPAVMDEINDILSEGYALALAEEARLDQLEQRLGDILSEVVAGRSADLRDVTVELRRTERAVSALRSRLTAMHERFIAVAAGGVRP
jgi:phosphoenolpyruvate-protein kinase (PTS system EI component)